jgi:hypothetical protein
MVAQDGSLGSGTLRDALDITRQKGTSICPGSLTGRRLRDIRSTEKSTSPTRESGRSGTQGKPIR